MSAMKFRKKPVVIEAEQFFPERLPWPEGVYQEGETYYIDTLEGRHVVSPGDWIITGVKGEKYPCKPDIFAMTYEPVEPSQKKLLMPNETALGALKEVLDSEFEIVSDDGGRMLKMVAEAVRCRDELFAFTAEELESCLEFDFLGCVDAETSELKWLFVVDVRQKSGEV